MTNLSIWGERSKRNLQGVHPDLVAVITRAKELSEVDFIITEGLRTEERQRQLFRNGASKTMNSRHLTGHAVDVAARIDGRVSWDWPLYHVIYGAVSEAADELEIVVEWGGNWRNFKDGPHYQLPRTNYPNNQKQNHIQKSKGTICSTGIWEKGDEDFCIRILQQALNKWADTVYGESPEPLISDGIFGYTTYNVVRQFQIYYNLDIDGIVGPITWKALESYL